MNFFHVLGVGFSLKQLFILHSRDANNMDEAWLAALNRLQRQSSMMQFSYKVCFFFFLFALYSSKNPFFPTVIVIKIYDNWSFGRFLTVK